MIYTVTVGSVRCHILSDGLNVADGGGFFGVVPRVMWQRVIAANDLNQVPNDIRCMLIESDAGLILVDTGNGDKFNLKQRQILGLDARNGRLVGQLAQLGVQPEDVDVVILTHLHGDHAGGNGEAPALGIFQEVLAGAHKNTVIELIALDLVLDGVGRDVDHPPLQPAVDGVVVGRDLDHRALAGVDERHIAG